MKFCPMCQEHKPKSRFHSNKSRHDGLAAYCALCQSERAAHYYRANRAVIKVKMAAYRIAHGVRPRD